MISLFHPYPQSTLDKGYTLSVKTTVYNDPSYARCNRLLGDFSAIPVHTLSVQTHLSIPSVEACPQGGLRVQARWTRHAEEGGQGKMMPRCVVGQINNRRRAGGKVVLTCMRTVGRDTGCQSAFPHKNVQGCNSRFEDQH